MAKKIRENDAHRERPAHGVTENEGIKDRKCAEKNNCSLRRSLLNNDMVLRSFNLPNGVTECPH